jgi:PAS domain S-box-containing protein
MRNEDHRGDVALTSREQGDEGKRAEIQPGIDTAQLRAILNLLPDWSSAPDGAPTHISQRLLDYSGMRFEDFKNLGWKAFMHPDDFPETAKAYSHAFQTGTSYQGVFRLRRADGEFRWHRARCEPLRDQQGSILQWYGVSIDIDDAKKAEDQLRRSEAYLAEAQRITHTGSWAWDPAARQLLYWSEECYRIWGFDPAQGLPDRDIANQRIHPDDRGRVYVEAQEALSQKRDYRIEFRLVLPDGTVKYLESIGHHLFSARGELLEVIGTNVDATERKRAQEEHERLHQLELELVHMNRLSIMGELAASLVHETTQPIASARNNARAAMNFLDRQSPDLGEVREALDSIVGAADRAGDIIDRIRDHIKKAPPRKHDFDLNAAINEVIVLMRSAIISNSVSVQTRLASDLFPVRGDRVQLQQVVLNLILNAVEAMRSVESGARELLVSTEQRRTNGVLVAVRDSGPGIGHDHLERVFQAFYTTKSSGTGVGLSICRSIIDAHGGQLWAEANDPRGAVFQFTLPNASAG